MRLRGWQVFGKGAKFSMFKPAEEMVYITLDEESRTKGKAAIDVVGAQSGKAISSMLQQVLLLLTSGAMAGALPPCAHQVMTVLEGVWSPQQMGPACHTDTNAEEIKSDNDLRLWSSYRMCSMQVHLSSPAQ